MTSGLGQYGHKQLDVEAFYMCVYAWVSMCIRILCSIC